MYMGMEDRIRMAETLGPLNGEAQQASVHRGKVSREERSTQRN